MEASPSASPALPDPPAQKMKLCRTGQIYNSEHPNQGLFPYWRLYNRNRSTGSKSPRPHE